MKKYSKKVLQLVLILVSTSLAFAFLVVYRFYISSVIMACILVGEVFYLLAQLEKNEQMFKQFIWSIRYSEFLFSSNNKKKENSQIPYELEEAIEVALLQYKKRIQQKESRLQYFQALANHIDLSVLVFSPTGKIEWMNQAAQLQTGIKYPETIDDLQAFNPELPSHLRNLKPGDISILQASKGEESYQLALSGMSFVVMGKSLTVVSMKNIRSVLDTKETEAWQKLIRVLTHEIMNSMTPIVSLAELLKDKLDPHVPVPQEELEEIHQALETICRRSSGLLRFVQNYRKVTGIPAPVLQIVSVSELVENSVCLFQTRRSEIKCLPISRHLQIIADKSQIEQVLINLIKNAFEATHDSITPHIEVSAGMQTDGYVYIQVSDNGTGIPEEVMERIFIPFFTTKPTGSGIGLSISRQIMHMHRGSLTAYSEPEKGSRFVMVFHS